jgi:hypothetical protein
MNQIRRALRQGHKCRLCHIFCQVPIPNHPQRCGVHQVQMAYHQFREGCLRILFDVGTQKLWVGVVFHL